LDPQGAEVLASALEESNSAVLGFIRHDASKGDTGSIIDGDMNIFPASAFEPIATVTGDAVTGPLYAGELLDVEMNELAWVSALVAMRRRRRIEQSQAMESMAAQNARDRSLRKGALACDLKTWHAQAAKG
jgi:hypothetical protein